MQLRWLGLRLIWFDWLIYPVATQLGLVVCWLVGFPIPAIFSIKYLSNKLGFALINFEFVCFTQIFPFYIYFFLYTIYSVRDMEQWYKQAQVWVKRKCVRNKKGKKYSFFFHPHTYALEYTAANRAILIALLQLFSTLHNFGNFVSFPSFCL